MKKVGIIPPHFLYYLENEGIDIVDYRSSNFALKENFDRMVVKFPYGTSTIDVQVIFDNLDISSPPDFVLVKDSDFVYNYQEIIKDWNFRESSSLYNSLNRIREAYSIEKEKRLRDYFNRMKGNIEHDYNTADVYNNIERMLSFIKARFINYKQLPKSSCFMDIITNLVKSKKNPSGIRDDIVISYPVDCLIRSRNINRAPILNIYLNIDYDAKFNVDVKVPHFVGNEGLKFNQDMLELSNFSTFLMKYEDIITLHFRNMQTREAIINKIIESNVGFPLEIDTLNFLSLSMYFHHNRNNPTSPTKRNTLSQIQVTPQIQLYNFILFFIFYKDDNSKMEFQIIDSEKLTIVLRKKLEYGLNDRETNNLLNNILLTILECLQSKKSKNN